MALPSTGVYEIRADATAGNVNGGGFNSARAGTDYSQQTAAQLALTDITSVLASTTITSVTGGFTDAMKGNYLHIASGTNFTPGWYELVTFTDGNNYVIDRACTTVGAGVAGVGKVGGAMSLNSTLDDELFETAVAGNIFYLRGAAGTLTLAETVNIAAAGSTTVPIKIIGYDTVRGDNPTGSTRPFISCGAFVLTLGTNWEASYLSATGTGTGVLTCGTNGKLIACKAVNKSTTAGRSALTTGTDAYIFQCEGVSYRGIALSKGTRSQEQACYLHDSNILVSTSAQPGSLTDSILAGGVTAAFQQTGAGTPNYLLDGCVLYGAENKLGIGVSLATGTTNFRLTNSIIYGCVTGVSHADAANVGFDDYNNYFNNTTDVTNWTKGANDQALDPVFTDVAQLTGSTATTSGFTLTQSGAFSTVTNNVDYLHIISGTGVTVGIYGITGHTNNILTLDLAPGTNATADKVWQIRTGHDFSMGTNLKAKGYPGVFPGGLTTGYKDIGVQRQEAGGGSGFLIT